MKKFVLLLLPLATVAHADTLISTGDTYKYINTQDSTSAATLGIDTTNWTAVGYDDSKWLTGQAPFGNTGDSQFGYTNGGTYWDTYHDPLLRKTLVLGSDFSNVHVDLGVDNGYDLYINGTHVSGDNAEGFTNRWEYSFDVPNGLLHAGTNVVALQLEDHGGLTAFDMQMQGQPVPEPASMAVLGIGAIGIIRRRRNR